MQILFLCLLLFSFAAFYKPQWHNCALHSTVKLEGPRTEVQFPFRDFSKVISSFILFYFLTLLKLLFGHY